MRSVIRGPCKQRVDAPTTSHTGTESNDLPLDLEVAELRVELEYVYTTLVSRFCTSATSRPGLQPSADALLHVFAWALQPEGTDDEDVFSI